MQALLTHYGDLYGYSIATSDQADLTAAVEFAAALVRNGYATEDQIAQVNEQVELEADEAGIT